MKAIFTTVIIERNGVQTLLQERISSLSYDRDYEKENFMTVTVEQAYLDKSTQSVVRRGDTLLVQFGYKGGKQSATHRVRVVDIDREYTGKKLRLKIKGRDEGTLMKKTSSIQVWTGVTLSQIASEIATRYGLSFVQDEPLTHVYDCLPQAQQDDWGFLQGVVAMEPTGNYICYIENSVLYLKKRALTEQSQWTIDFAHGENSSVIKITTKETESSSSTKQSASKTAVGFDKDEGEMVTEKSDDSTEEDEPEGGFAWMGDYPNKFSANSDDISKPAQETPKSTGTNKGFSAGAGSKNFSSGVVTENIGGGFGESPVFDKPNEYGDRQPTPTKDKAELRGMASGGRNSGKIKRKELTVEMEGMPEISLNTVITLTGVDEEDEGNYLVKAIKDDVSGKYITTLTCWKNASKRPSVDGQEKAKSKVVNKTQGDDVNTEKATKKVLFFNANSNEKIN